MLMSPPPVLPGLVGLAGGKVGILNGVGGVTGWVGVEKEA